MNITSNVYNPPCSFLSLCYTVAFNLNQLLNRSNDPIMSHRPVEKCHSLKSHTVVVCFCGYTTFVWSNNISHDEQNPCIHKSRESLQCWICFCFPNHFPQAICVPPINFFFSGVCFRLISAKTAILFVPMVFARRSVPIELLIKQD